MKKVYLLEKKSQGFFGNLDSSVLGRKLFVAALFLVAGTSLSTSLQAQITGTVFRDYNGDGVKQAGEPAREGIIVKAYRNATLPATDALLTQTTTDINGNYTLNPASYPVRLEFSIPTGLCNLDPSQDFPAPNGDTYGSAIQFASGPGTHNFIINYPADFSVDPDPQVFTSCFVNGDPLAGGSAANMDGFVRFNYLDNGHGANSGYGNPGPNGGPYGPPHDIVAVAKQLGSTWGVAYSRQAKKLFTPAFMKRHAGLGPLGAGGIYMIDANTYSTAANYNWLDFDATLNIATNDEGGVFIANPMDGFNNVFFEPTVGSNPARGLSANMEDPSRDAAAWEQVGKVAFGDIDITEDGQFIYVVNLYDRKLYSIDVTDPYNPIAPTLADVGTKVKGFAIPNPCSTNPQSGEMRPFALKIARGKVFVGLICSAQNQNGDIVGTQNDMTASVYTFDIATQTWDPNPVLQFPLNYRESTANKWVPWTSEWVACFECQGYPMLADIEFDGEGNMILGLMDRRGHQAGWLNMDLEGVVQENIAAVGDILRAVRNPNVPSCEYSISFDPEFYKDDKFHLEPTQGGLAVHRTSDYDNILAAYMDPVWIWSGGVMRFDNKTGNQIGDGYEIYFNANGAASGPFGKAHGIGDLEVVEEEPSIEVGNRVWVDIDRDGIQDADEPGLANVDVQLKWPDGTVLATVQTDGDGDFFFFLNNVPDGDPIKPGVQKGIQPYTDYKICIPATEFNNGQPLNNFLVTQTNATGVGAADQADNDGVLLAGGDVQIMFTTTARGENNHTLDFGFAATDYGDLPNTYGTTDASNGPWHWINPSLMLGSCVDGEMDGQPQSMAGQMTGGDDNSIGSFVAGTCAGSSDDENGIIFSSPMIPGSQACITVNAINNTGASAVLQAWIDWNGNGVFEATDQLASGHFSPVGATVPVGGLTNAVLCFDVPANASFMNGAAFTRFRLSPAGGLASGGGGVDGEVEDYKLALAKVGTLVWNDQDNDGTQNEPTSAGLNGVPVNLTWLGPNAAVGGGDDVQYTTTTSTMGGVNGIYMFLGLTPGAYKIAPDAPAGYLLGQENLGGNDFKDGDAHAGVIFTINDPISLATAENGTGDIPGGTNGFPDAQDDLSFDFNYVTADYGDLPAPYATTSGSNGPSHIIVTGLRIGSTTDGEPDGQPSVDAFGDGNDENGVSFPIMYIGLPANITVNVLNTTGAPATLYGFIDWNKDGIFTGPNESLTLAVPDGTNGDLVLPFVVPAGAVGGMDLGARFRLSNAAGLTAHGPAPSGEVEDYLIQICDVVAVVVSHENVSCFGGNDGSVDLTVTNGNAPFTYDWSNDGPESPDDDIADVTGLSAGTYTVTVTDNSGCTSTAEVTITQPAALTNAISNIDDANCLGSEDGSATATANGGVSPYDYAWSHGFTQLNVASSNATGLGAGGYNVTVTDVNGCTVVTGFEIADPTGVTLVVNAPITNETCDESNNGSASVTASGGTPPFTFNWTGGTIVTNSPSSTASNLQAGTYLVTATDANGCWAIQTIVITQPTDLVAQIVGKLDAGCAGVNDGSATVTATGGITHYTYDWSNDGPENPDNDLATVTGLAAGTYTVTVTDANGCTATTSVIIGTVAPLALTLAQENENQCGHSDGSIDLTVSGGTPAYTYDWSIDGAENPDNDQDDLTGLSAGTYTVTVTDARGCSAVASVILTCTIPASIGNYTWIDTDADGIQDGTESPLPGVVVILSGTDNNGNDVNAVQATDGNGLYLFDDLFPGTYKLTFVTPVGGYVPTTPNAPLSNDANDSDAVPGMGGMTAFEVLTAGEDNRDYDAGYYIPASIGDYAWVDDNANGVQDSGEPGLEGVIVMLTGTDALGNAVMLMATTDVSGYYIFADLVPGTYKLKFTAPTGTPYEMTGNDLGGDDAMDSDANESMGGMTVNETLISGEHNPTYDAGFYIPASLGDYVWVDKNANGVQEAGESNLPRVTVKLQDAAGNAVTVDADGNAIVDQETDANGFYQFANLIPGTYKVMFVNPNPAKYTLTAPNAGTNDAQDSDPTAPMLMTQTTTLGSGDNDPTLDAGFYSKAKVGNFVWHDLDADGIQDPMEPGINNVTVTLTGTDNLGNPVSLTTSTTGNGMYMFGDLVPGSYKITFGTPGGYTPTDADQGTNDALDSDFGPMGMTPVFTVQSGDTILTFDAGFYLPAQIGNYTWIDANADGDQDGTESPLPGVLVVLTGTTGSGEPVNLTATTDANGLYLFSNLQPGTYKLTFQTPFGNYLSTTANDVNATESTDSDADPVMGGMSINEVLTSGESNLTYDAGYYELASIGDFVWHDLDGDGVQDGGEPGIGGVTVTLTGTDGQGNSVTLTTTTAPDGSYLFPDLVPGTYKLTFTTPAGGYVSSDVNEGGNDANDSDADPSMGGMTANEILTSGEHNPTYDAGYYLPAEIGNYTWIDANANGIQDMGEAPISGVPVTLTGTTASGDAVTLNDVTDGNGLYLFTGLEPGTYKLTFGTPAGYVATLANDPDDATDALDSDANPAMGGMTINEVLTSGESNLTYDAGYYALASIGNYTWIDTDADGIQDPTESPLPGVTVTLTGTDGQGNPVSLTDVTDGNGLYLFENLVPGTYKLTFTTPAGGYVPTDANQGGDDAADSDADPLMGGMTVLEVLTSGENNLTYDAGYYLPAEIGNYTWIDANADGDQDGTESPLPGVLVILNGTTGSGESVNLTTTTDANGLYLFNNLQPGTYKLTFQTPFGNYISTTANDVNATESTDSDADPAMGGMSILEVLTSGESNLTYDAGYYELATIGNFVWNDANANGIQEVGEDGIPNVSVTLTGTDGQGNPVTLTTTTDGNGLYLFPNLVPGTYKLTFGTPAGFDFTSPLDLGGNDALDSDANPANANMTVNEILTSGEVNLTYDAGFYQCPDISIVGLPLNPVCPGAEVGPITLKAEPNASSISWAGGAAIGLANGTGNGPWVEIPAFITTAEGAPIITVTAVLGQCNITETFVINVDDSTPPVLQNCPSNLTVGNDVDKCGSNVVWTAPTAVDNCDNNVALTQTSTPPGFGPGSLFPVGVTTITYEANDGNGNTVSCTFTITVTDMQAPNAVCKDITVNLSSTTNGGTVTATATQVNGGSTDNCTPAANLILAPASTTYTCANLGDNVITLTVTDAAGNTSTCAATVTVRDVTAPTIVCPANLSAVCSVNEQPVYANLAAFTTAGGSSSDNCGVTSFILESEIDNGLNCPKTVTRVYRISDASGNTATCAQNVVVNDLVPPSLTCPGPLTAICSVNEQPIYDNLNEFTAAGGNSGDNCGVNAGSFGMISQTQLANVYTRTYRVSDNCGNSTTCAQTVTVLDVIPPVFSNCPANITVGNDVDKCGSNVFWTAPSATDNCVTVTVAQTVGLAPGALFPVGTTTVTYVATDATGNTVSCNFTITVTDMQAPNTVCKDITVNLSSTTNAGAVTVTAAQVNGGSTDNCTPAANLVLAPASTNYTCANVGDNLITLTVTDAAGNTSTCVATVTVVDASAPVITTCPANVTVNDCDDVVPAMTNQLVATDNCGVASVTQNPVAGTDFGQVSGNAVTVTFTVTDVNGNVTTCTNTITIVDNVNPAFTNCPANITVGNDVEKCGANVFWTAPSASDNCSGVTVAQTIGLAPGALYPVGTTAVRYVATDASGNTISCNFTVTVTDMQAPNAVCKDITVNLSSTTNAGAVTVTAAQVNGGSTDNCTPAANLVLAPASTNYTCANVGDRLITLTVTDAAGNTSTCVATVTVVDASAPVITTCPANVTVNDCDDVVPAMTNQLVATDNCGVASVTQNPVAGTDFGQVSGNAVTVTFTVTDVNGNVTTCTNTITIVDNVNPAFTNCPANITVGNDVEKCGANVFWTAPSASDNCSGVTVAQTIGLAPGALYPVGTTAVRYVATDASGNTISCNFTVTVTDMQAPNAVCKDITVNLSSTTNAGAVTVTAAQVNGGSTDNCTPAANLVLAPASTNYTCANVGDNLITLTVTDAAGNTSTCVATVTVVDASAPVITTCPANVTVNDCDDVVPAMTNQLVATDNCGVASVTQNPVAGTDFGQVSGNAVTVTFTVTDVNGNVTTCTNTITIVDNVNPAFTNCPANITVGNDVEKCGANVFWTAPSASDNCSGVTVAQTIGLAPGALYPVGTTAVRYVATDASGNTVSCNFTVTVTDMQAPNAVCKDITVNLSSTTNAGAVTVTAAQVNGGSTDNCTPAANLVLAPASTNYNCANVGDNLITLTVTDASGNVSTCVATVTVRDVTPPVFTCPAPVTVPSCTSTVPNVINGLTATDNCGVASIKQNPVAGSDFGQVNGNTVIVTVTVTDVNGNVSTCDVVVTIIDAGPPVFVNCPTSMIMIGNDPDQCNGKVNWPIPVALDECLPLANVVQTAGPTPGSVVAITCPPTPTNITYKATDGAGNMSFCNFQIMVIDTEKPEFDADILMPGNVTVECDAVPTNCIPRTGGACTPLTVSDVNDNCAGPLTVNFKEVSTQDPNPANCGHYSYTLTRTWTITDCADNALIAAGLPPTHALIHIQVITVRDTKAPTALCKNATVKLDKTGKYILDPQTVNNGSFDNCAAFPYLTFSVTPNQFTCANLGPNLVTLSVTDPCGNVGTCQATVTVEEGIAPCTPQLDVETVCMGNSGNATTLDNGQFQDIITIKSLAMQTWSLTVNSSSNGKGAYSISSPAPPASPVALPIGTLFTAGTSDGIDNDGDGATDEADEMIYYTLKVVHVECKGYDITVSNAGGIGMGLSATTTRIENKACYPYPYFSNLLEDVYCLGTPAFTIAVGEYANAAGSVVPGSVMVDGVPTTVFDASALGLGAHTVMATFDAGTATQNLVINGIQVGGTMQDAINDPGCKQKITKVVNIVETPTTLICNDLVYVSMDEDCKVTINADEVLEGTYFCYDDYTVEVDKIVPFGNGPWVMAMFDASDLGKTYQYHVIHSTGGQNLCWGQIKIEDKLAPALTCPADLTIACSESTDVSHTGNVIAKDCSAFTRVIDDEYQDFGECASPRAQIVRTWIVTDTWGNQAACSQTITITPFDLDDVVFPAEAVVNCESAYNNANATSPDVTGRPSINGAPIGSGGYCSASVGYTDVRLEICAGSYEIYRTWLVANTCLAPGANNPVSYVQRIRVKDFGGPQFVCPPAVTVSTDPLNCCATAALPDMIVSEGCSDIVGLEAKVTGNNPNNGNVITFTVPGYLADFAGNNYWNPDTLAVFNYTQCLPVGEYNVRYKASDECGNTSYCSFKLTVADLVPPVAACDQFTQVSIGADSSAYINAATFNDGSYDNCAPVEFKVRRMLPNDCQTDTLFHDQAKFCCTDIGDTIMVVFRVYDLDIPSGDLKLDTFAQHHYNDCMVSVLVEDKIKPTCSAPAQVAVNCENFDPSLWTYGFATGVDNCCLDTITTTTNYALFDTVCNKGTITRTFRSSDCAGNTTSCTQRVIVTYEQDYFVKFPNDVIVTVCDGTGNYGDPIFFGEDCELLGVTYADEIFTVVPDACFEIQRTWQIINWCTFNPNLPFIDVPNPTPNAISNAPQNLPGPTVSACGTLPPWKSTIVKINPSDPLPGTDYCTFWDKNANGYRYKQIIKITDTQAPTGTYTTPTCDNQNWNTANNNALWNEMHWWDNGLQIHDLCEEPTDLCITGTDACSGSNVNIEYLLFLDLDNDGTMETVINSVNTGLAGLGWNNVQYGNASNPNFGGGTARTFDTRPVPSNLKYGFTIQETVVGTNKTACVRWNTQQQQSTYVTPELPNGTHKIKWFITDGCGNNKEYEYSFTVKDCKAPTVVCLNGLSTNIMPTGMIQLWANDFLQYTEDNCTPAAQIKTGIRKCGTGTGFPLDAQGNPITSVNFTCAELGTQCVELWAIDAAGNADYCETYVIVQDNNGNCATGDHINVAGAVKTEMTDGVEETTVNIAGTSSFTPPFAYFDLSDANGTYAVMNNVPLASTFVIAPEKDDNPLNGVTTYDLVLISKHILGTEPFDSPYKMIAADANKSGSITTFDVVELRKLILGIYTELPNNTSWRFVDKSFVFPNANNPFQTLFPETISVADAISNQVEEDFAGVKVGDVNNTVVANATMQAEERTQGTTLFDVEDRQVKPGEEFEVNFKAAEELKGFQFTMLLDGLKAISTVNSDHVNESNFNLMPENAMAVSIDGAQDFTVKFRAEKAGKLSNMLGVSGSITRAEAYGKEGRKNIAFRYDGKSIAGVGFELYQNQPNPFVNKTSIGFFLPETAEATLSIFDETGRMVYQQKGQFAKGENMIGLDRSLLNTTGVLYYKLETATDSATRKMIQAK